ILLPGHLKSSEKRLVETSGGKKRRLTIVELLRPHRGALILGLLAIMGESAANLLGPWPLKIVLDSVLRAKPTHGWLSSLITRTVGTEKIAMLEFACAMVVF